MKFVGREEEQKKINYILNNDRFQGCIIYGRRRLGKTELIKHCLKDINHKKIIYQCKESNEYENTNLLTQLVKEVFQLDNVFFDSFFSLIEFIFKKSLKENIVLVIDEYPYIKDLILGCDSKLQELIDKYVSSSHLKLFLLGSSISTMEDVLSNNNPLYGRFNQSILIKQMDYYDSSKFYESFSNEDKVILYSVFGGVPFYNIQIDEKQSVKENIIRIISGSFSGLKDFLETYLKLELRKINNANIIFDTIANGAYHYSDILAKSHIESSPALNTILQKLIKMDLIHYIGAINDKTNKQKAGYRISDLSLRFYYQFIYKNESAHRMMDDDTFYNVFIKDQLESSYVPEIFETICQEYIIRANKRGLFKEVLIDVGTYWYDNPTEKKNGQFDVVGKCQDGYIFFECKYTNGKVDDKVIEKEIKQVNETTLKAINYGFISKNGFKLKNDYPYYFITLDDLYK